MSVEKKGARWGTIGLAIGLFAVVPLMVGMYSASADDEVLEAAEAVRELIRNMDIPEEEKQRFLAQIGGVEGTQKAAIRLDIESAIDRLRVEVSRSLAYYEESGKQMQLMKTSADIYLDAIRSKNPNEAALEKAYREQSDRAAIAAETSDKQVKSVADIARQIYDWIDSAAEDGLDVEHYREQTRSIVNDWNAALDVLKDSRAQAAQKTIEAANIPEAEKTPFLDVTRRYDEKIRDVRAAIEFFQESIDLTIRSEERFFLFGVTLPRPEDEREKLEQALRAGMTDPALELAEEAFDVLKEHEASYPEEAATLKSRMDTFVDVLGTHREKREKWSDVNARYVRILQGSLRQ